MPALADPHSLPAEATSLSNAFVCQPQQRNMHGRIFGGFLMRRAFELAFATTYLFAGSRPSFVRVDDVTFRNPVDVGSLLRFTSHVVHVAYRPLRGQDGRQQQQQVQQPSPGQQQQPSPQQPCEGRPDDQQAQEALIAVEVAAAVCQPEQKAATHTNTFRYVFAVRLEPGQRLRRVLPATPGDVARLARLMADDEADLFACD